MAPYIADVSRAFRKMQEKFPSEVTAEFLAGEILAGKRQLWLVLDDEDRFLSFGTTEIRSSDATGVKMLYGQSFAGEVGLDAVPLLEAVEEFGRQLGCIMSVMYARRGWTRELQKQGYNPDFTVFRKNI